MAQYDITVPAGSVVDGGINDRATLTGGNAPPGDFDGATINSVSIVGTPTVTSDGAGGGGGTTDDTWLVRFNIEDSGNNPVYGGTGADEDSICWGRLGDSVASANIENGSATTPAPTTAVASNWNNIHWQTFDQANMKADDERASWASFTIRVDYTPAVIVNQASETDTAQPITINPIHRLVNQASETDTAQPITAVLGPRVWLNTAANGATLTGATQMTVTAWSLDGTSVTFSDPVGAPIGSGLWLGVENGNRGEANTGWIQVEVTASGFQVTVNQASETDTAQPITPELRRLVTQASETDTAQPIGTAKSRTAVQTSETDTSQPIGSAKTKAIGLSSETDTAQPVGTAKSVTIGQASEIDTAQPIAYSKSKVIGQASETDTAQPITYDFRRLLAQATETDTAFTITPPGTISVTVNQASETDTAQPITVDPQHRLVSPASETDTAQPITPVEVLVRSVGQATETDTAPPFTVLKTRAIGQSTETDTARPIPPPGAINVPVGQAIETDTAQPITWEIRRLVGLADEIDDARPITVIGGTVAVEQGGGSGGHGAVILPPRPYVEDVPEPPPGVSTEEILAVLAVIDMDQHDYD